MHQRVTQNPEHLFKPSLSDNVGPSPAQGRIELSLTTTRRASNVELRECEDLLSYEKYRGMQHICPIKDS